jgi:hypothetical protein
MYSFQTTFMLQRAVDPTKYTIQETITGNHEYVPSIDPVLTNKSQKERETDFFDFLTASPLIATRKKERIAGLARVAIPGSNRLCFPILLLLSQPHAKAMTK